MNRKWWLTGAVVALVLVISAGGILLARRSHRTAPKLAPAPASAAPAELNLIGPMKPRNVAAVAAPVEGVIDTWFVEPGQEVYKDQLLGKIRSPQLEGAIQQAQLDLDQTSSHIALQNGEVLAAKLEVSRAEADQTRARSDVDVAEKAYNRQKGLWDAGATPRPRFYEKAEQNFKDAKAALEKAGTAAKRAADRVEAVSHDLDSGNRAVIEKTQALERAKAALTSGDIHSPADGIVISHKGNPGDPVDPSIQDLVQIATQLTSWQVMLPVVTFTSANIHAGQTVSVHVGQDDVPGTVREVTDAGVLVDFTTPSPVTKLDQTAQVKIK